MISTVLELELGKKKNGDVDSAWARAWGGNDGDEAGLDLELRRNASRFGKW